MREEMQARVDLVLTGSGGAASRSTLRKAARDLDLDSACRAGMLARPFRRAYCRPWDQDDVETLEAAAVASVGMPAALSHVSALRRWGLLDAPDKVHVTVPATRSLRPYHDLALHRTRRFPRFQRLRGVVTVTAADAIATSWPLLDPGHRRAPAITAVRQRLATPADLRGSLSRMPRLPGRHTLDALITLLAAGCESELEIWGFLEVFAVPGLDHGVRQRVVRVEGRTYRLDLAFELERLAVELDGDAYHSTREQRERDRRRDSALASVGWLTLRFSHARLHSDVQGCRREVLAALAARRPRP